MNLTTTTNQNPPEQNHVDAHKSNLITTKPLEHNPPKHNQTHETTDAHEIARE